MTKINYPNSPIVKPLKDYPIGQFFVITGDKLKCLAIKVKVDDKQVNLFAVDDGYRIADSLDGVENWLKENHHIIIPVDVEINVL